KERTGIVIEPSSPFGVTEKACLQWPLSGHVSPSVSEMQASDAHLDVNTQMSSCQGTMLDHQLICGDGGARLSLSSAKDSCVANTDPGKQWMLFPELNLDTCIELQKFPKLEGDALGGLAVKTPGCELNVLTDTMSVLKQKIMKRKQLFCKWRMACRFPGLQASENHENDDEKDQNSLNSR
ncbi:hypothetical protein H1C71_031537, partial [Ictidomys tridecemlineatus]